MTEQVDMMPEVTNDEIGEVTVEELKKILVQDISQYEDKLVKIEADRKNYKDQLKVDQELWSILLNKDTYKKVNPDYVYEQNPRYWELQYIKLEHKLKSEQMRAESTMQQFDYEEEMIGKDLEDKKSKLADLNKGE